MSQAEQAGIALVGVGPHLRLGPTSLHGSQAMRLAASLATHTSRIPFAWSLEHAASARDLRALAMCAQRSGLHRWHWRLPPRPTANPSRALVSLEHLGHLTAHTTPNHKPHTPTPLIATVRHPRDVATAAQCARIIRLHAADISTALAMRAALHQALSHARRSSQDITILTEASVVIGNTPTRAAARRDLIEATRPTSPSQLRITGTPLDALAIMSTWTHARATDGWWLQPGSLESDTLAIIGDVIPHLRPGNLSPVSL